MSSTDPEPHGRHELSHSPRQESAPPNGRSGPLFSVLGLLLCLLLGVAIVTQVRQHDSEDALETARPADLLVLLDSLRQREATLGTEVAELQQTLDALQKSGSSDQAAIENAQARLAALAIMIGTVGAVGPGVVITIDDAARGVAPETMLDVINELRAAGAEAMEVRDGTRAVRIGVDSWVAGAPGAVEFDGTALTPPYSVLAIGDPPTLAAAMNIPGGAVDSVRRLGGAMTVQQADRVEVTVLRQPKPRQYAQPVK
ncbi:DUF881 domain-containing protein [Mycolicibacter arupensis]|uniref:DUF881 domain-containing protein n=1 Tax=Mycolicibacter arupensis TaxID=342002 RepID=A0A0F5MYF8_9MYCO|nr:DUF881 domain-containing protein [Mycolicibacter arupensis]KAA1432359.1 DUF881 domain-containing protein [Mycolicibacter arupensis]KKB99780.1 hypothetical protein WR43_08150 [Mycolicibacter arupensis]MCV7274729.1 DUF881 domain-containing protein [Mycolicibacter arupensis]ORA00115.1 hypothetical protein BST15_05295 [Mycolicibacter arupensis]TXI57401.1 MAG: DUF881 domain-containing protein [Mycolicibacter arupensis]